MGKIKSGITILLWLFIGVQGFGQQIKALSYNIKYDNQQPGENSWDSRKEKLIALLNHYKPAVIGTQEGLFHQLAEIDKGLPNFTFFGVGRDDGKQKGEYCAIFYDSTRLTLTKHSTFWLSDYPEKVSVGWDAALPRVCTYGLLVDKKTGHKFWVFNTHFDHMGEKAREESAKLIVKKTGEINTQELPIMLMGDFNANPEENPIHVLKSLYKDGKEISQRSFYGPNGTFNGFIDDVFDVRIDYIFVKNMNVISYMHIDDRLNNNKHISDHYPVMITASPYKIN